MRASTRRGRAVSSSLLSYAVAETLERRTLFAGDIPSDFRLQETVQLRYNRASASTSTLLPNTQYYFRVTGVAVEGANPAWDAEYKISSGTPSDTITDTDPDPDVTTDVGLKVNGGTGVNPANIRWGSYNTDHEYVATYTTGGSAASLTFTYQFGGDIEWMGYENNDPIPTFTVQVFTNAPLAVPPPSSGGGGISSSASGSSGNGESVSDTSATGVRYFDGQTTVGATDLSSAGFGRDFGITRTWTNGAYASKSRLGNGWVISQMPYVLQVSGNDTLAVVLGTGSVHYFDLSGGNYSPRYFDSASLRASSGELIYRDSEGNEIRFDDFANASANKRGQFKKLTDVGGNTTQVPTSGGYHGDGTIARIERSSGSDVEAFEFTYSSGLITNIALKHSTNSGSSWTTRRQVDYGYYGSSDGNGNLNDLKSAIIKDASGNALDTHYYRYYVADSETAYEGGLKGAFGPSAVARITNTSGLGNPLTTSLADTLVGDFADDWFEYDTAHRVTLNVKKGAGGPASAYGSGRGAFTYAYEASINTPGVNSWAVKTTETRPDSSVNVVFTNAYGQPMLKTVKTSAAASTGWSTFYKYDSSHRLVLKANPSAIDDPTGGDTYDTHSDLLDHDGTDYTYLKDSAGLVETYTYYASTTATTSTTGGVSGWEEYTKLQLGESGTPKPQTLDKYLRHDAGGTSVYVPKEMIRYRGDNGSGAGTGAQTTSFSYTWHGSTHRVESMTISYPTVDYAQNGPGGNDTDTLWFDTYGRVTFTRDGDGYINATEYDNLTGAVTKTIVDVSTTTATNEPSGWSTPGGGGSHLTSIFRVDGLGRTTKVTDPNGNNSFIVYKDTDREVRTYPGWTGSATTGPTTVVREDRANGYVETFTMTTAPDINGSSEPAGTESPASLQTLSRSHFSIGGQLTDTRRFFSLPTYSTSASLGTENTHYYKTAYQYDSRGRANRTLVPTGTIYRTVYDELSRPMSSWVGTDDSPSSGTWSPSNLSGTNTVVVSEYEYDSGGVGDSNVTKVTSHPTGATSSTYDRVTQNWYDWRNRLVASKGGVQASESTSTQRLLNYYTYNNLGQVTESHVYDADNVTISTSTAGVPDVPSSSLRRAKQTFDYDDQGRLFASHTFSVDPSNGNVSTYSLNSYIWYDRRGNAIKTLAPGGLVGKSVFDGAGRLSTAYSSDGGGDVASGSSGTWSDADDVTGDKVLEQAGYTFDANGNLILQTTRQRMHDATTTGSLGLPSYPFTDTVSQGTWRNILGSEGYSIMQDSASVPAYAAISTSGKSDYTWTGSSSEARATQNAAGTGRLAACWYSATSFDVDITISDGKSHEISFYCLDWDSTGRAQTIEMIDPGTSAVLASQSVSDFNGGKWVTFKASSNVKFRFTRTAGYNAVVSAITFDQGRTEARTSYTANYFDSANRPTHTVQTGTSGGQRYIRPTSADSRSDTRLVTSYDYSTQGWLNNTTDPRGLVTLSEFDAAGRTTTTYENYVNGTPSGDDDRKTVYTHDGMDHVLTLKAYLDSTNYQETKYVYDSTASGNDVKSMDVLTEIWYPNKSTGAASSSEKEVFAVNALGEQKTFTDRNGNVHAYSYDVLGRLTDDKVTTLGSGVDDYVQMLSYAYNTQGLLEFATSYSDTAATTVRNQVQREYNGLGQITKEYQAHSGSVNTSTTPKVQYHYSEMPSGANHSRLTKMTYPNGRILRYEYASGLDSDISRLSYLADDSSGSVGTHLEEYTYLGLASVVERNRPQPGTKLTYLKQSGESNGEAGDQYAGLDRFGRIADQRWRNSSGDTDRFKYAYDRNSNALYKDNVMTDSLSGASDQDELYHVDGASAGYDGFNRLTAFQRGKLSDANSDGIKDTVSTEARSQSWSLDQLGNWSSVTTNGATENRTHNKQNQLTATGNDGISFDANGNVVQRSDQLYFSYFKDYTYDAWNRLVRFDYEVGVENDPTERIYRYDALNRRQLERTYWDDFSELVGSRDLFWTVNWQVIEEKNDGPTEQWVYSPLYVDSPILRDRDYDQSSGNGLEERRYAQHDANFNTTSITNASGAVQERFLYDNYGTATSLNASWSVVAEITGWKYKFQGARWDSAANLYDLRFRDYDPSLGRWLQNDPIGYPDGFNRYQFVTGNPINGLDPSGLVNSRYGNGGMGSGGTVLFGNGGGGGSGGGGPRGPKGSGATDIVTNGTTRDLNGGGFTPHEYFAPPGLTGDSKDWLDRASSAAAGYADGLTLGLTRHVRHAMMGDNDGVDYESGEYEIGQIVGVVHQSVLVPQVIGAVRCAQAGTVIGKAAGIAQNTLGIYEGVSSAQAVAGGLQDIAENGITISNAVQTGLGLLGGLGSVKNLGPGQCFVAGTQVVLGLTEDDGLSTRDIEDIRSGDVVLAKDQYDPNAPLVQKRVVQTFRREVYEIQAVSIRDFDGNVEVLRTTDEHPFWVVGLGWIGASHLQPWMHVLTPEGRHAVVQSVQAESHPEGVAVYNFEVEDAHTYFVEDGKGDQTAVWVHNTCGIYEIDVNGQKYIGQSVNIERRAQQHIANGKITASDLESLVMYPMEGSSRLQREVAEQILIDSNGGVGAGNLLNIVNPIGPNRIQFMPPGYSRN